MFETPLVLNERMTEEQIANLPILPNIYIRKKKRQQLAAQIVERIFLRTRAAEAQNWRCCYCGIQCTIERERPHSSTLEHVTPLSKGGTDDPDNLVMACGKCNLSRGNTSIDEFIENGYKRVRSGKSRRESRCQARLRRYRKRVPKFAKQGPAAFELWLSTLKLREQDLNELRALAVDLSISNDHDDRRCVAMH